MIATKNAKEIACIDRAIGDAVNGKVTIQHPEKPFVRGLTHVESHGPLTHPEAHARNAVLITPDTIDRSSCGAGTSAKGAVLYSKGQIVIGEELIHESTIGTAFRAKIVAETGVARFEVAISEAPGTTYATGIHQLLLTPVVP